MSRPDEHWSGLRCTVGSREVNESGSTRSWPAWWSTQPVPADIRTGTDPAHDCRVGPPAVLRARSARSCATEAAAVAVRAMAH